MTPTKNVKPTQCKFKRALVVDDCPVIRKLHSKMLERLGFDVLSVCDGAQALTASANDSFDVILMDCEMPVMDGLAATRALRTVKCPRAKETSIIGVTSSGMRNECAEAGMNAFLAKPLHIDSLAEALRFHCPNMQLGAVS
jgi:CheY-like chemotaxis protein